MLAFLLDLMAQILIIVVNKGHVEEFMTPRKSCSSFYSSFMVMVLYEEEWFGLGPLGIKWSAIPTVATNHQKTCSEYLCDIHTWIKKTGQQQKLFIVNET